jgi:uncharacterized protein (DUF433 family)
MASTDTSTPSIERRADLGLAISGTRITLYDLLDYLHDGWPPHLIRDWLNLTDAQVHAALDYIATHRDEVEAEYRQVLAAAEESRRYWDERNRERFAAIAAKHAAAPPDARRDAMRAKLAEQRARLEREEEDVPGAPANCKDHPNARSQGDHLAAR